MSNLLLMYHYSFVMRLLKVNSMAAHDDFGKKSTENELPTFNAENLQSNMKVVYCRSVF